MASFQTQINRILVELREQLEQPTITTPFTFLGLFGVFYAALKLWQAIYLFARPSSLPRSLHPSGQKYLTYALVTGASDGIGRALCFELSRRGFSLAIHGRNETKLNALADELHAAFEPAGAPRPVVLVAQADFCDDIDFAALVKPLQKLRLTVLINNVGAQGHLANDPYHVLADYSRSDVERLVDLNLRFMALLTRELVPLLLRASDPAVADAAFRYPAAAAVEAPRAPGARAPRAQILNASSAAAIGVPYVSPYAGSKGFVESFSKALRLEFRGEGFPASRIQVLGLRIGNVQSSTNRVARRLFVPDADMYARAICERVGCNEGVVVPWFLHWLQVVAFAQLAPQWALDWGILSNMKDQIAETGPTKEAKTKTKKK